MFSTLRILLFLVLGLFLATTVARAQYTQFAQRLEKGIEIDGEIDAEVWATGFASLSTDAAVDSRSFTQYSPEPLAPASFKTSVWVGYDDEALYVVAFMHDPAPDSILKQLSDRDRLRNTDWFGVTINPYRDGINATNFVVTPANVQYDSKFGANIGGGSNQVMQSGDVSWDGVWQSAVSIVDSGWIAELKILYSALRFPEEENQTWDINYSRQVRRYREESFWHPVDPAGPPAVTQMGTLTGIRNIKPPVRLQATPFVTAASNYRYSRSEKLADRWSHALGGGLDLKYGINDAFTLDMTAVPDFSNARSDDLVLNLTANEIFFEENRAFFTEGVELFNKGDFFYSRRVGGVPFYRSRADDALANNEVIIDNPIRTNLLNATKVSGRMDNGLGIGVFNAIEGQTTARLRDTITGAEREVLTGPRSNYSVVSFDQNLPNNSFVTLLNTTALRSGGAYDANLTGVVFDLRDKTNSWSLSGKGGLSQQYHKSRLAKREEQNGEPAGVITENVFGHTYNLNLDRIRGRLRYGVGYNVESDTYDPNDMGFLFFNNERSGFGYIEYNWFEPIGKFNSGNVFAWGDLSRLYRPNAFSRSAAGLETRWTTRDFFTFGAFAFSETRSTNEFQDSRTPGVAYQLPTYYEFGGFISSDYRKRFALDVRPRYGTFWSDGRTSTQSVYVSPRFRVNDKLDLRLAGTLRKNSRYLGYIGHTFASAEAFELEAAGTPYFILDAGTGGYDAVADNEIVGSYRTIRIAELEANVTYSFTANMNVNLRVRHYWSRVNHDEYFVFTPVNPRPQPTPYTGLDSNGDSVHDQNFNAFNVDLFYRWRFAPGSDIFLSYKTQSFYEGAITRGYFANLGLLGDEVVNNNLTLKIVYWLDWNELGL